MNARVFLLAAALGVASSSNAALAQDENGLGHPPAMIPGTSIAWPADDSDCDKVWKAGDYKSAIGICTKALGQYRVVIDTLVDTPNLKDGVVPTMIFDEAYTEMEVASAYEKTGDVKRAFDHASLSAKLAHSLIDPIGAKLVRDESAGDKSIQEIGIKLLDTIHQSFPAVAGSDGKADT